MPRLSAVGISALPAQAVAGGQGRGGCQANAGESGQEPRSIERGDYSASGPGHDTERWPEVPWPPNKPGVP